MILAIDIGNTNIVLGCLKSGENVRFVERLSTDRKKTILEYAIGIKNVLEIYHINANALEGAIISSVVPQLTNIISEAVEKVTKHHPLIVGPGVKNGLKIKMDNPAQVGSDLIVEAVAGVNEYPVPLIIIDMGTATTLCVVDKECNYIGGMILPGVRGSLDFLVNRASQLSNISLDPPKRLIGKNTIECMQSGMIHGSAACIDGMIERIEDELGEKTTVIATGGLSDTIIPHCKHHILIDDALLLKGLILIYSKNQNEHERKKKK